jgi:drug/metabolite transporter (DMT)-like permease
MLAIVLALGASLAWGLSDFLGGLKSRSVPLLSVLLVSQASALVVLAVVVAVAGGDAPAASFLLFGALAGISEAIGVAALYRGLAVGVTSIVAPTAATAPAVPLAVGIALGEVPEPVQAAGIALAVAGIVIIVCRSDPRDTPRGAAFPSVALGLVCALGFGGFYVAMDAASEGEIPWALLAARATAVLLFVIAKIVRPAPLAMPARDVAVVACIGLLIIGADAMYATASTHGILGVVAALSTLYPVVTIALAHLYLKESVGLRQQVGIATCLCGVVAISAGA